MTGLSSQQAATLRHYADGRTHNDLGRPVGGLLACGWVERVCDDFFRITPSGRDVLAAYRNRLAA